MILVKHIPDILSNKGRKTKEVPYKQGMSVSQAIILSGIKSDGLKVIHNGKVVKDSFQYDRPVSDGDEIIITPDIKIPAIVGAIGSIISSAWFAAAMKVVAIALTIYSVVAAITQRQRKPNYGSGDGIDDNSPTYGWDGIRTTRDVGLPVPVVYGTHKVGGNIINEYIWTDGDRNYLNILLGLCEGEIDSVSDIKLNDNPIANFSGCSSSSLTGTNSQSPITAFEDLHDIKSTAYALAKSSAVTYTTVGTAVQAFELHFTLPSGLWQTDASGNTKAWAVTYQVEYKLHAAGSYTNLGETTISATSMSELHRVFRKDGLTAGQYDIRVTKTSDDSDSTHSGNISLVAIDEIINVDLAYPNTALLGLKLLATDQLSGGNPNITCIVKGKKVYQPQIMNGASEVDWEDYYYDAASSKYKLLSDGTELTWDGATYVTKWSANPIWCIRDMLINTRYGLGEFIDTTMIDDALLLEMSQYCEQRVLNGSGQYEKRFTMNLVIDASGKALDILTQMASTFNGLLFYSQGMIKVRIDKADTPAQLFGMGNIIAGSFAQNWVSAKDVPNVIEVQYLDAAQDYIQEQIAVIDETSIAAGDPMRKKQLRLFSTSISEAIRFGRYMLNSAKYTTRSISFKVGIDALACQAGDVINVSHEVPQWGFSGRVQAGSTTTHIKLDNPATIDAGKTYKMRIKFADDTSEEKTVIASPGSITEVDVVEAFSQTPAAYDNYAIGEIGKNVKPFRIINMRRDNTNEVEIQAVEYNASIYDDSAVTIPTINYSALQLTIPEITNLSLTERMVKLGDGTIENCIDVWFNQPSLAGVSVKTYERARIYLSDDDGLSWRFRGETRSGSFTIMGGLVDGISYTVAVVSVTYNGEESAIASSPQASIDLVGKSASPSNVSGFIVKQSRDRLYFYWTPVTDIDLSGYEIRYGASWEAGDLIASNIKGNTLISLLIREGASQSFWIKAMDTSGNFSATETEAVLTVDNIPFTNIVESYSEQTGWAGTKSDLSKVGDNLEIDAGKLTGTYETPVRDVGYVATFKIGIDGVSVISGDSTWQDFGDQTFADLSEAQRFSGVEIQGALTYEIKTSEDNITWSDYSAWQQGDYKCRYFQLRMTMTRTSTGQTLQCSQLDYYADLPDVDEFGTDSVSNATTGKAVTFSKTYHETPSVNIDIRSGDGYLHKFSVVPDTTGFTVKLYDLSGVAKTGDFAFHVHGV